MYFVLIGTRRRTKSAAAKGIRDLYAIPHREAEDDGRTLLHVGESTPVCADCDRGHLQWAEAGYGPWHRICDQCGSHWDLHPIVWGPGRAGTNLVETPVPPASRKCLMALAEEIGYPEDLQSASDAALRTYLQDYLENSPATMQQRASDPNMLVR